MCNSRPLRVARMLRAIFMAGSSAYPNLANLKRCAIAVAAGSNVELIKFTLESMRTFVRQKSRIRRLQWRICASFASDSLRPESPCRMTTQSRAPGVSMPKIPGATGWSLCRQADNRRSPVPDLHSPKSARPMGTPLLLLSSKQGQAGGSYEERKSQVADERRGGGSDYCYTRHPDVVIADGRSEHQR